jgi:very-short-patch-repair endonuclease
MAGGRAEVEHIEVTVPRVNGLVQRAGVATHRSATLTPDDCTRRHGIPVTKPARTLTDLRRVVSPVEFAKAVREAEFLQLQAGDRSGIEPVRSELENTFFQLCRRHRLPKPAVNEHVARYVVDFLWRDARLIAEVDGWESHRTRSAFEDDRARDAALALLGYRIVRFTWRQINADAGRVGKTIRDLLRGE